MHFIRKEQMATESSFFVPQYPPLLDDEDNDSDEDSAEADDTIASSELGQNSDDDTLLDPTFPASNQDLECSQ